MSHMDVTQCRPRIIHKAEYLDANRERAITSFDYAKINRGNGE
ncbi:integrase [Escherichia coli]|nr:integrase [Escherichia coli]EEX2899663.1 integrase [Escherichia coli]EFA4351217.1 integrase [Escherichia coli]EFD0481553.1 integrase [Escherichia coli]EFO2360513.1 integrase [Escherichia coli]